MPLLLPQVVVCKFFNQNYGNDSNQNTRSTKKTEYKGILIKNAFISFMSVGVKIIHNDFTMNRNEE